MKEQKKNKKEIKKQKAEKKKKKADEAQEELKKLIDNINNMLGDEAGELKMFDLQIPTKKEVIITSIVKFIITFILLLSLSGFVNWIYYENILYLFAFLGIITVIDFVSEVIIKKFFRSYVVFSFGAIFILTPIIAFTLAILAFPLIEIKSIWWVILVLLIFVIVRKVFLDAISKNFLKK